MKRFVSALAVVCLVLLLTACFQEEPYLTEAKPLPTNAPTSVQTQPTTEVTVPTATIPNQQPYPYPMAAVSLPLSEDTEKAADGKTIFTYTYQTMALTVPDPSVGGSVASDYLNRFLSTCTAAVTIEKGAQSAYSGQENWIPYFYRDIYTPTRLDQSVLSFFVSKTYYDGAPHSNIVAHGVNYDLLHGTPLMLREILVPNYDSAALCKLIIKYFDHSQSEYFYPDYDIVIEDMFSTNIPMEDWYFTNEGLCFFFNPGEIAPYSEEIPVSTIPYAELLGLLQDSYFPAETVLFYGTPVLKALGDGQIPEFDQIAEVIVNSEAPRYCLSVDGTIQNVRILVGNRSADGTFAAEATIFAAQALTDSTASIIQISSDQLDLLMIEFDSGGEHYSVPVSQLLS